MVNRARSLWRVVLLSRQRTPGTMRRYWARGVAVNMSPCHGEDHRFESGRARRVSEGNPASDLELLASSERSEPGE